MTRSGRSAVTFLGIAALLLAVGIIGAYLRVHFVTQQELTPVVFYDGGEIAGVYTMQRAGDIHNKISSPCDADYTLTDERIENLLFPAVHFIYVHNGIDERMWLKAGDEIILADPCTGKLEAVGRLVKVRPTVQIGDRFFGYPPARVQIELYEQGWMVRYTKNQPHQVIAIFP